VYSTLENYLDRYDNVMVFDKPDQRTTEMLVIYLQDDPMFRINLFDIFFLENFTDIFLFISIFGAVLFIIYCVVSEII
jgi:hypothetical protein